ncbi:MAG: TIR domain-containing protein [Bryobacterales bacterium]|nr:TIR domain-containing protein [Bryobacterales bacterium]
MPTLSMDNLSAACGLILCGQEQGTGYLVSPTRMVTCYHVVRQEKSANVRIAGQELPASVTKIDEPSDCAVLELTKPVDVTPLRIASGPVPGEWRSFGFPGVARGTGITLVGTVLAANASDVNQQPSMQLYSDQVAAGTAASVSGFSGSPVVARNLVIGHLKRILEEKDKPSRPIYGVLFATQAAAIRRILGLPEDEAVAPLARPAGERHFLISYRSNQAAWARELADNLTRNGLSVFLDQEQLVPGGTLATSLEKGLTNAQGAVALITKDWLNSPWCQQEAAVLLQRSVEEKDFKLVPLLLEDVSLPAIWASRLYLDFRGQPGPRGPALDRLILALAGDEGPAAREAERAVQRLLNGVKAQVTAERVYGFWNRLQRTIIVDNRIAECAADRLISLGRPDYALEVIGATGESVRARQLKGNALAKTGRVEDAIEVLRQLEAEAPGDPETRGMLAARYRQMWESTGERSWLIEARETYKLCFDLTGSTYCGINAASLALMDGKTPEALRIAGQLISKLEVVDEASRDRWYYATAGEAYLILNDLASAREAYRRAVGKAAGLYQDIAVMRQGVRRTCKAVGQPESSLDDILTTPAVFAFFGHSVDAPTREKPPRFPKGQVGRVSADIRAVLDQYRVHFGVSSACSGGDLLFLGELLKRGGQVTIVLPMEPEEFRETFLFGSWAERFDKILPSAVVRIAQPRTHEDVWDACRREIRDAACDIAGPLQEPAQLLVLWDGDARNYVKRAIDYWEELGDPVIKIMLGQADSANA